jgi:serine/threonine-protein kinase
VQPAPGVVVAGRFRLVRRLGEGGMGMVWAAHHLGLDTPCAVKLIHEDAAWDASSRARFEREARAAAQLRGPHVVQVLDYGVYEDTPYIAMELLDGEDLAHRLARVGRLGAEQTLAVVAPIARALAKAHGAGLVHRDLKPENVFLVRDDDGDLVKVLDFGIAKSMAPSPDGQRTKTGAVVGTPFYMSPEQAQGLREVDHRTDLWALAVLVYRCLVGQLPFESDALGDLFMRIIVHPLPVPSQVAPGLPPAFDAWWAQGAARDPAQRFQSARDMVHALAAALGVASPQASWSVDPALAPTALATSPAGGAPAVFRPSPSPAAPPPMAAFPAGPPAPLALPAMASPPSGAPPARHRPRSPPRSRRPFRGPSRREPARASTAACARRRPRPARRRALAS